MSKFIEKLNPKPNQDVRDALKLKNKKLYELADALGIADTTLSRWLRHELPQEWKQRMFDAIEQM